MNISAKFCQLAVLATILMVIQIAATPAVLPKPEAPTVRANQNVGEIVISWNQISGAQYYTVGWVNGTQAKPVSDAGGDWLSHFHYTTVRSDVTSYTVNGLTGGNDYYGIIRVTDNDARFGGSYSEWSEWSSPAQPLAKNGDRFCPVAQLPEEGFLGVGDEAAFGDYLFQVKSIDTPVSVTLMTQNGTYITRQQPSGRRWLRIHTRLYNGFDFPIFLQRGNHYAISTDSGNAFAWSGDHDLGPADGRDDAVLVFDIPDDASVAVLEVRPMIPGTGVNVRRLFRFSISAPTTPTTTRPRPDMLSGTATSPHEVELTWSVQVDDARELSLFRDGQLVGNPSIGVRVHNDTNLDPNTRYTYRLTLTRSDGTQRYDEHSVATLAYPPMLSDQMATHRNGLQQPIVDYRNPDYTEYRIILSHIADEHQSISNWSTDRCRIFDDLRAARYKVIAIARNLDGIVTAPADVRAENVGNPQARPMRTVYPWHHDGTQDPWVKGRIRDTALTFGLTDAAVDWMGNDILIEWKRGEPGWAGYRGGYVGIGHSDLWTLMHETMHAFWQYWDGFPQSCDRMNKYTFRRDVAQFALDFRDFENSDVDNPLEPWRPYYNLIRRHLRHASLQEDFWDALERGEYGRFEEPLWHQIETSVPAYNPHHASLIPPRLRHYFHGFMKDGAQRSWTEEQDWITGLADEDRFLWSRFLTHEILRQSPHVSPMTPDAPRTRIPEPLRTTLHKVNRQMLIDFVNTLGEFTGELSPALWTQRFREQFVLLHLHLLHAYADELDSSPGIELEQTNLEAVVEAMWLLHKLHCKPGASGCRQPDDWSISLTPEQVRNAIATIEHLTDAQRTALLGMVELQVELRPVAPRAANSEEDLAALLALYESTGGSNWANDTNWSTTRPLGQWYGVETEENGRVVALRLNSNRLSGVLPTTMGSLTNLAELNLGRNQLTGEIPPELANLTNLVNLNLASNQLTGSVPQWLADLSGLKFLELNRNNFSGQIPKELGSLSQLEDLRLLVNHLDGEIPAELGNLTNLRILLLSQNMLSGPIPAELGDLSNLEELILRHNQLTGEIPSRLGDLSHLRRFDLTGNQLTGCIPEDLRRFGDHGLGLPFC